MKLLPILFLTFFSSAQQITKPIEKAFLIPSITKDLGVAVMNYEDLSLIEKYKKFELGIQLPEAILSQVDAFLTKKEGDDSQKINPFLEWEMDVEATFIHPESASQMVINGFYYRNFERNSATNGWIPVKTNFPMRIRFAPQKTGDWQCIVTLKVNGKLIATAPLFEFNVIDLGAPGFVKVHQNKRNFERDGKMIFPIGQNFPSPEEGVATYHNLVTPELPPGDTYKAAPLDSWMTYHKKIEGYFSEGGKYIRTVQAAWSNLIEFEEKGNYYNRLNYAWEQDYLLEVCEKNNGLLFFNLLNQEPIMNYGNYDFYDWDWGKFDSDGKNHPESKYPAYCYNDNVGVKQPHEMFINENDLLYHEQRTRYYISRYGYSTAIYNFELLSEPFHLGQFWKDGYSEEPMLDRDHPLHAISQFAVNNYHRRISSYIKKELGHTNQLIGINATHQEWNPYGTGIIDSAMAHSDIDIIGMNPYGVYPNKLLISKSGKLGNNSFDIGENSYARMISEIQSTFQKPVIISEGGPREEYLACSDFKEMGIDNHTLQLTGFAAYAFWNGFRNSEKFLWEKTIMASNETNQLLLPVLQNTNGNYIQGRQKEPISRRDKQEIKELQYFISEDLNSAVGYVRNRSYNFFTNSINKTCKFENFEIENAPLGTKTDVSWDEGPRKYRLEIQGMKPKTTYEIEWFSENISIGKSILTTNRKGNSDLEYPALTVTEGKPMRAVLWFSLK